MYELLRKETTGKNKKETDVRATLILIVGKQVVSIGGGWNWLRIVSNGGLL